jgi:hypothetical protein
MVMLKRSGLPVELPGRPVKEKKKAEKMEGKAA